MRWWSTASIRVRLTAWYTAVLALMLVVYAAVTFLAVRHEFREQLEEETHADPGHAAEPSPEERVEQQLGEILVVLVPGLPVIVVLAGVGGYVLARRAFWRPSITSRAKRVGSPPIACTSACRCRMHTTKSAGLRP